MQRLIVDQNETPRVYTIDKFLSPQECLHIIKYAEARQMERATIAGPRGTVVTEDRTNSFLYASHDADDVFGAVAKRIAGLVGLPLSHAEDFQVIHYQRGQEFRGHYDGFDPTTDAGKWKWRDGGQRILTAIGYLNTVQKGGGTLFNNLGLSVPATQGKLLVFHNTENGTIRRHPGALHSGMPVEAGDKWAFNMWFRARSRHEAEAGPTENELIEFTQFQNKDT